METKYSEIINKIELINPSNNSDIFGNGFKTTKAALIASTICYKNDYRTYVDKPGVDPTTYFAGKTSIGWT